MQDVHADNIEHAPPENFNGCRFVEYNEELMVIESANEATIQVHGLAARNIEKTVRLLKACNPNWEITH